jgi:hypothetical protein
LTTKTLAERCASLGASQLTAPVLMNIESGRKDKDGRRRRDITVKELLVLAYALKVSPLALLLPEDDTQYAITSEVTPPARAVYEWLVGERLPPLPAEGNPVEWTDEDRACAWFIFTRALRYVPEPSTHWLVNAELQRIREHEKRDPEILAELREEFRAELAREIARIERRLNADTSEKHREEQ